MSKRDASLLLADMREAMGKIARYVAGMSREAFFTDEKTIDAVVRGIPRCRGSRWLGCGIVSCMITLA